MCSSDLYVIADNKLALNAGWNMDLLSLELQDLKALDFDLDLLGFDELSLAGILATEGEDNPYSVNIEAPTYEPSETNPDIDSLLCAEKTESLILSIDASGAPEDVKRFLRAAAYRHDVFDFGKIADFYAHANSETKELMEASALVIIDYDKALENGFIQISNELNDQFKSENDNG